MFYLKKRRIPKIDEIFNEHRDMFENPLQLAKILDHADFKHGILSRGVPWIRPNRLSAEQMYVLAHVLDPTVAGGLAKKLKNLGYSYVTWTAWMKNPEFRSMVASLSADQLEEHAPMIQQALLQTAEKGDMNAIKFYYEITQRWDPNSKNAMDVMAVLSRIVEIITKHVTDPSTLAKIGAEVQMLANTALGGNNGNTNNQVKVIQASEH